MKKIQYHFTNIPKQVFLFTCFIFVALNFTVMMEIAIFKLPGYYEAMNLPAVLVLYISLFVILITIFFSYKFCYSIYDENHIIYHNKLLRRSKEFNLSNAKVAVFDTFGVGFYNSEEDIGSKNKRLFFLPFFRFGLIEPIQINNFYKMLRANDDIKVIKKFKVLPGYTKKWTVITILYGFLAVLFFMNCARPLTVVIVLLQNH